MPYYLPQFHTIPENDKAWGKGFTEWTNVKKARPLFEGHYQPRLPLKQNYYTLPENGIMEAQAELAQKYGIYGFCYYHYYFAHGKKLLEKPLEYMLHHPSVDIPFCLSWANENWTRRWDGGNNEVIISQDYEDMENLDRHIDYLCEFFADPRYIKENGKPFFIIYRPLIIPNFEARVNYIRERVSKNGFPGIVIAAQHPSYYDFDEDKVIVSGLDACIEFEHLFAGGVIAARNKRNITRNPLKEAIKYILDAMGVLKYIQELRRSMHSNSAPTYRLLDYDEMWQAIIDFKHDDKRFIAGAFKDWDSTPRHAARAPIMTGATPEKFRKYMTRLIKKVREEYTRPYIFLNAWNEWAEGSNIEPDERFGYQYLEALRDALNS
ncbi:MAG: glycoside hydrolase family 99-like domain-containing protein [Synergistaceae bacterium]|nr:glycoside hydrolase family 99-like domain-containing protein [Synergistaceae bacterium]MBQ9596376.1 glycoside hydrolase family 99-like domain-containing protein [Synergistaceae bacterium]